MKKIFTLTVALGMVMLLAENVKAQRGNNSNANTPATSSIILNIPNSQTRNGTIVLQNIINFPTAIAPNTIALPKIDIADLAPPINPPSPETSKETILLIEVYSPQSRSLVSNISSTYTLNGRSFKLFY